MIDTTESFFFSFFVVVVAYPIWKDKRTLRIGFLPTDCIAFLNYSKRSCIFSVFDGDEHAFRSQLGQVLPNDVFSLGEIKRVEEVCRRRSFVRNVVVSD